ncbi:MAG: lamin tail domain-containing protein [bacterium]
MSKKIIFLFAISFFFSLGHLAFASFSINEVMYNLNDGSDAGREWIEIYNNSGTAIDLSTFKFFEKNTNHGLTIVQGDKNISAHGYAVIVSDYAKFKIDWPNFSGSVFDSTFSLGNDGESLAIKDESLNVVDEFTYNSGMGAMGDGNSLQKISGSWIGATPTPGKINESVSATTSLLNGEISSTQSVVSEVKTKVIEEPKIKTSITVKGVALAGIPIEFQSNALGYSGEKLFYGKYFWNFGDGDSKEIKANDASMYKFTHTYFYPGEYVVSLEYYLNYYGNTPDAFNKITIKVVKADVVISRVGDEQDFFVELSNNTEYDTDISNWKLSSNGKSFSIPRNTTIRSGKKMIISSKITNFSINDKNNLKLLDPQWGVVFDYGSLVIVPVVAVLIKNTAVQSQLEIPIEKEQTNTEVVKPLDIIPLTEEEQVSDKNLVASVISSDIVENHPIRSYFLAFILTIFIGGSSLVVYFIRQKKIVLNTGDDFKILDE